MNYSDKNKTILYDSSLFIYTLTVDMLYLGRIQFDLLHHRFIQSFMRKRITQSSLSNLAIRTQFKVFICRGWQKDLVTNNRHGVDRLTELMMFVRSLCF